VIAVSKVKAIAMLLGHIFLDQLIDAQIEEFSMSNARYCLIF
jgi:hypothetical protein